MGGFSEQSPKQVAWQICFTAQIIIRTLGTKRGGMATYDQEEATFKRSIQQFGKYLFSY